MRNPVEGPKPGIEETHSPSLVRLFGQIIMLPLTVFVQGMDLFVKTITGMQRAADKGMNVMASEAATVPQEQEDQGHLAVNTTSSVTVGAAKDGAETINEEER